MSEVQSKPARRWLVVGLVVLLGGLGVVVAVRWFLPIVKVSDLQNVRTERSPK